MSNDKPIRRIAIIGTGVIGASWTSLFLAKGLRPSASPAPIERMPPANLTAPNP